ncbi:acid-resistance membrane protein [Providencia rustigianii]|nr:acid-resistance membrane protein [Providencia rustigianii]
MLNINREKLLSLASGDMKKQRNTLIVLAVLLLLGGIVCLLNPMASGIVRQCYRRRIINFKWRGRYC